MSTSEALTRGFRVRVESRFVPERSSPATGQWFFSYTIRITNEGDHAAQLVSRHWVITDATGRVEEVEGPGVVGKQPFIEPGSAFEYTSFCPLGTPFGTMQGTYRMMAADRERFDIEIAPFALSEPHAIN